jgi:hypothetical protein
MRSANKLSLSRLNQRLRATFYVEGETVWSVSIGTHDIYKG